MKVGQTIILTDGQHSDYCIVGTYRVSKDVDINAIKQEYPEILRKDDTFEWVNTHLLKDVLIKNGYLEELDIKEIHLDDFWEGHVIQKPGPIRPTMLEKLKTIREGKTT